MGSWGTARRTRVIGFASAIFHFKSIAKTHCLGRSASGVLRFCEETAMNAQTTKLKEMRDFGGALRTPGLADAAIESEAVRHPELVAAIEAAHAAHVALRKDM